MLNVVFLSAALSFRLNRMIFSCTISFSLVFPCFFFFNFPFPLPGLCRSCKLRFFASFSSHVFFGVDLRFFLNCCTVTLCVFSTCDKAEETAVDNYTCLCTVSTPVGHCAFLPQQVELNEVPCVYVCLLFQGG